MQEFDISKKYRLKSNKYKKIILYNDSMKEESDIKQDIVSEFQNELLKKGITNYIWGGYGTNLYINNISINTNNEYIKILEFYNKHIPRQEHICMVGGNFALVILPPFLIPCLRPESEPQVK